MTGDVAVPALRAAGVLPPLTGAAVAGLVASARCRDHPGLGVLPTFAKVTSFSIRPGQTVTPTNLCRLGVRPWCPNYW